MIFFMQIEQREKISKPLKERFLCERNCMNFASVILLYLVAVLKYQTKLIIFCDLLDINKKVSWELIVL